MEGRIYKIIAGFYDVKSQNEFIRIRGSGKLRFSEQTPVVGDFVTFSNSLENIKDRKNILVRPKVANVDQLIIVVSLSEPSFSSLLLDKFLSIANYENIEPIIIFTKQDLVEKIDEKVSFYEANFTIFKTKFNDMNTINPVKLIFKNKTSVLMGQTGVGKTTLFNNLTDSDEETQAISKALGRGKHTTRVVSMHDFLGGQIIDSPGFSLIDLGLNELDLAKSFLFHKNQNLNCKYRSCLHKNESLNDCSIKQDIEKQLIPIWRYENYLKINKDISSKKQ
ncbi:ribosome biogenesis GTPase [Mycoplasma testudineum]|uniref:Small ribosomal subunit biogenesis GTPase RsgA n=1 Tax=Mycoplasma testudineum TaxID=244584 RepID=A0A4R6ID34_9MOLU|nr:ribosome small subunit-dependent GTPase A [Mycoplasma testudineum]OYD26605.1 ribosome small subunit-dependent GTPase A [Mycoplasma testudineum]TDO19438.1 ribosome biogenesis GTPase [Mycoplasma testudineum]